MSVPAPERSGPEALVRCLGCRRRWHGAIAAHGLKIVGRCPRCSGKLAFRPGAGAPPADPPPAAPGWWGGGLAPWQILGITTTWDR